MKIKRNVLRLVAGLVFALSASMTHAAATYDASAETSAEVTGVLNAAGQEIAADDWSSYISAQSIVINDIGDASAAGAGNFASATWGLSQDNTDFVWGVNAAAEGQVSAPGFAESSAWAEIEVAITNLTNEAIQVVIDSGIASAASFNLDTAFQTLDTLYAESRSDGSSGIVFGGPIIGPDSGGGSVGPFNSPITRDIAAQGSYVFTLLARAEGRISQVPAPATLLLMSLGLAGLGYQQRKQVKAA